jgi:hypothetical protein
MLYTILIAIGIYLWFEKADKKKNKKGLQPKYEKQNGNQLRKTNLN